MIRRALVVGVLLTGALGAPAGVAAAAPPGPQVRCELDDERVAEASGLVAGPDGPAVVNDSGNPSTVFRLDRDCDVTAVTPAVRDGVDVEDLARGRDGTLWLADTGDNRRSRPTVAILRLPPGGGQVDVALRYPDGPHDAETLLLPGDGRPVVVTKDPGGRSGVYTTDAPLTGAVAPDAPTALRRVGEVVVPPTTTPSGSADAAAVLGGGLLTGGAISADGRVAALRTYTDAWLYPVADPAGGADAVVAALRGRPVQVPLPGEPQGEAIAFEPDGTLLSASESPGEVGPASATPGGALRAVPGAEGYAAATPGTPTPTAPVTPAPTPAAAPAGDEDGGLGPAGWIGVAIAVVVGGGGVLWAVRRGQRRG